LARPNGSTRHEEIFMSKEATASAYTLMLNDETYREEVAQDADALGDFDLSDDEIAVLREEASTEVTGFAIGMGPVMGHLSSGPPLSGHTASSLGIALNRAGGLPSRSLTGLGFASSAGCCPWGGGSFVAEGDSSF
jgi:hypothetical protein